MLYAEVGIQQELFCNFQVEWLAIRKSNLGNEMFLRSMFADAISEESVRDPALRRALLKQKAARKLGRVPNGDGSFRLHTVNIEATDEGRDSKLLLEVGTPLLEEDLRRLMPDYENH